jgi:hypothetical protein
MRVHPRSIDAKLASESRRIDEPSAVRRISAVHELDYTQSDSLDPRGVDSGRCVRRPRRADLSFLHTVHDPQQVKRPTNFEIHAAGAETATTR